ncbi:glycosyltransferase family 2 protein [Mucilaginibacter sp. AW1-3]
MQTEVPFFSVIIPTYNRGHLIEGVINSALEQLYQNFEVIVVDDGSTDNTEQVIKGKYQHLPQIRYIKQRNAERGAARNTGLKNAKGKYVNYFDSDDVMYNNHLSEAYKFIQENNYPEIFLLNYVIQDENTNRTVTGVKTNEKAINRFLIKGNLLSCNGVVIRNDIALNNMFNEDRALSAMEDWELWLRMACKYPILFADTVTSVIVNHDDRSVVSANANALEKRADKLIKCVLDNEEIVNYYKADMNKFISSCYTYVALHIALTHKNRFKAMIYTVKGIAKNPLFVFERRFLAIIKHLIIN